MCDIYTIKKEGRAIKGLKIALWGDLKYGRAIHSLTFALARFGATILFRPAPGLELPEHVIEKLTTEYGGELERCESLDQTAKGRALPLDAIYITPSSPHQLAMIPDISIQVELKTGLDAIYVTRLQKERLPATAEGQELNEDYPVVDKKFLKRKEFKKTLVMHPLPRVDELAYELDADPRSMYFKQAAWGVPVRMALIALLLGDKKVDISSQEVPPAQRIAYPIYKRDFRVRCPNPRCVSVQETETKYIKPEFKIVNRKPLTLRCIYCEHGFEPRYLASSDWHEGRLESKKYHSADSHWAGKIKPENLIIFNSESEAEAHGFKPSSYAKAHQESQKGKTSKKQ